MALDEPRDNDATYEIGGFTYLVDKDFLAKVQPIKVDYMISGFKLDCAVDFGAAGGCSSCGSGTCG